MDLGLPIALVVGVNNFVAKAVVRALREKDMKVIGIGENDGSIDDKGVEIRENIEEVEEKVMYVFDFLGDKNGWKKAVRDGAKLEVLMIDKSGDQTNFEETLKNMGGNWRIFEANEVYGVEMDLECNWLGKSIVSAVLNKPLYLPKEKTVRPLAVADVVEAAMRACFLSGTSEERFVFGGAEIETEVVENVLKKVAKMTKEEVLYDGEVGKIKESLIEDNWQKLRWVPTRTFEENIEETMQFFFTIADEVGRQKNKNEVKNAEKPRYEIEDFVAEEIKKESKMAFEVVEEKNIETEDEEERLPWVKPILPVKIEEETEDIVEEEEVVKEEYKEIKKEIVKTVETKINKENPKNGSGRWKKGVLVVFLVIIILLAGTGGVVGWRIWELVGGIGKIEKALQKQQWSEAEAVTSRTLEKIKGVENFVDGVGMEGELKQALRVVDEGLTVVLKGIPAMKKGQQLYESIFKDKDIDLVKVVGELESNLSEVEAEMGVLQARVGGGWHWMPGIWKSKMTETEKALGQWREEIQIGRKVLGVIPELVGGDGKRRDWMVMFQNEHELRPSGGFLGSFGILSFENGKLLNLDVRDIYSADGQLKGHVEPPAAIKKYLGEAGWYMRDANWLAGFPEASKDILWFLEKETGRKVDGVIGINLSVAKGILGVVGEVYLPDYKEKVNKDNLYEQAEFYSEQKFFPGSQGKANFLGALSKQLFEQIRGLTMQKQLMLMSSLLDLAKKNELQIMANEKKMAQVLSNLGWDGALYEGGCVKGNCVADYLYVVEANLGVNKANYFIYRTMEQVVEISKSSVARIVRINYQNTAKSNSWPGGDYKNYIRVYVPNETNLASVLVYDSDNQGSRSVINGSDLTIQRIGNKKEIGFLVVVPFGKRKTVELRYSSNIKLEQEEKFSYLGYIQRQSGFGNTGLVSLVSYPAEWQPLQVQPSASIVANKLVFNQKFDQDIRMGVEIGR